MYKYKKGIGNALRATFLLEGSRKTGSATIFVFHILWRATFLLPPSPLSHLLYTYKDEVRTRTVCKMKENNNDLFISTEITIGIH